MALPAALASLSSARSSFLAAPNDALSFSSTPAAKQPLPAAPCRFISSVGPVVSPSCTSHGKTETVERLVSSRRVALASTLTGLALALGTSSAHAAMQKVEGTRRDTQDAVTRGLREPSQISTGKGNTMKEAGRNNAQASGGTILGAPRFEEPGGAYRSPQSQTEKSFDKRSTPAGVLQKRQDSQN